jgi:hypothetical protein
MNRSMMRRIGESNSVEPHVPVPFRRSSKRGVSRREAILPTVETRAIR